MSLKGLLERAEIVIQYKYNHAPYLHTTESVLAMFHISRHGNGSTGCLLFLVSISENLCCSDLSEISGSWSDRGVGRRVRRRVVEGPRKTEIVK